MTLKELQEIYEYSGQDIIFLARAPEKISPKSVLYMVYLHRKRQNPEVKLSDVEAEPDIPSQEVAEAISDFFLKNM